MKQKNQESAGRGRRRWIEILAAASAAAGVLAAILNQRFINLSFSETPTEDSAIVYTPKNGGIAPPGDYMLFVVYDGVPSYGKYVKID